MNLSHNPQFLKIHTQQSVIKKWVEKCAGVIFRGNEFMRMQLT
jgi:hypothetical protein